MAMCIRIHLCPITHTCKICVKKFQEQVVHHEIHEIIIPQKIGSVQQLFITQRSIVQSTSKQLLKAFQKISSKHTIQKVLTNEHLHVSNFSEKNVLHFLEQRPCSNRGCPHLDTGSLFSVNYVTKVVSQFTTRITMNNNHCTMSHKPSLKSQNF